MIRRDNLRCPYCGGVVNKWTTAGIKGNKVILVLECWSGNLNKSSNYHLYTKRLPIGKQLKRESSAYNLFVKEAFKDGKSITEAARLWQSHKISKEELLKEKK